MLDLSTIFIFLTSFGSLVLSAIVYGKVSLRRFSFIFLVLSIVLFTHGLCGGASGAGQGLFLRKLSLSSIALLALSTTYHSGWNLMDSNSLITLVLLGGLFLFSAISLPTDWVLREALTREGHLIYAYGVLGKPYIMFLILGLTISIVNFDRSFRIAKGTVKWRIKYLVWGLILGLVFLCLFFSYPLLYGFESSLIVRASAVALSLSFYPAAYAVLRRSALKVDFALSHQAINTSLVALFLGLYFIILGLFFKVNILSTERLNISELSFVAGSLALIGVFLALSERLRRPAMSFVHRHFLTRKYDYQRVWTEFAEETRNHLTLDALIPPLSECVAEVVGARWVAFFERRGGGWRQVYGDEVELPDVVNSKGDLKEKVVVARSQGSDGGTGAALNLSGNEGRFGLMLLGPKISGEPYDVEDIDMLTTLAEQARMRIYQAKLSQEMALLGERESISKFAAFLLHDLKNVAAMLSLLLKNAPGHLHNPDFQQDLLSTLSGTQDRIKRLMQNISIFPVELEPNRTFANLNDLLTRVVSRFSEHNGRITIELRCDGDIYLSFDEFLMDKIFTNIVLNANEAIEHSGVGGKIEVEAFSMDNSAVVKIRDDGPGLPESVLRGGLFKPFNTTKEGGSGIGLYQCKLIAEAHGGDITVDSERGRGTEFVVTIPIREQETVGTKTTYR